MRYSVVSRAVAALVLVLAAVMPAGAGDPPRLSDPNSRIAPTDLTGLLRLRFLTTLDFPPFNFADPQRRPTGFNVEIVRAICAELGIEAKCEIQAMPWEELDLALDGLRGEAIIAGHGISTQLRANRVVSRPYFKFPARFVARSDFRAPTTDMYSLARDRKVAVVAGSAHAEMLKSWFREAVPVEVQDEAAAYTALQREEVELVFGDGVALSFWLASLSAGSCCSFVSGPFLSDRYLGPGMAIVMRKDSAPVMTALNAALNAIEEKGVYREIYQRYFPLDPYADGIGAPTLPSDEGQAQSPEQSG
ncbi:transporter substrate-binding domain-containing protein [Oricola indica]|jgi:polar amino acid transport system substrate-binding protein|uniref:transporter substrate-binding domain-containing protein n=1 Tax=Oricola indica TaxID=2872591 RepID=UPI003CCBFFE8